MTDQILLQHQRDEQRDRIIAAQALLLLSQMRNENNRYQGWRYEMQNKMQEIVQNVFLEPFHVAAIPSVPSLQQTGITHILCVRESSEAHFAAPNFPDEFTYAVLDMDIHNGSDMIQCCLRSKEFIDNSLSSGGRVLVHECQQRKLKSAAIVIGYLMAIHSVDLESAYRSVEESGWTFELDENFKRYLKEYQKFLELVRDEKVER